MQEPEFPSSPPSMPPPMPQGAPVIPELENRPPRVLRVYGIMHAIFAGLSFLMIIGQLVTLATTSSFSEVSRTTTVSSGGKVTFFSMQGEPPFKLQLFSAGFDAVVSVVMLIAAIKLLKERKDAIKWSNIYAGLSVLMRITLAVTVMMMLKQVAGSSFSSLSKMGGFSAGGYEIFVMVVALLALMFPLLYPLSALYFLNQAGPKEWLEKHGK